MKQCRLTECSRALHAGVLRHQQSRRAAHQCCNECHPSALTSSFPIFAANTTPPQHQHKCALPEDCCCLGSLAEVTSPRCAAPAGLARTLGCLERGWSAGQGHAQRERGPVRER
eukprot:scaffold114287_cov19-Tisochrysis_lutea.AAC.2